MALKATSGPILELGVGFDSTPYISEFVNSLGGERRAFSFESNEEWMFNFVGLRCDNHRIEHASPRYLSVPLEHKHWGCALVDHSFGGVGRVRPEAIQRLKGRCDVIVAHDTEDEHESDYGFRPVINSFKYRKDDVMFGVRTTMLSDTVDLISLCDSGR